MGQGQMELIFLYIVGRGVFTTAPFSKGDFISGKEGEERKDKYPKEAGNFLYFFSDNGKACWYVFNLQVQQSKLGKNMTS